MHVCALDACMPGSGRDQKRPLDTLELENRWLLVAIWVLGIELGLLEDQSVLLSIHESFLQSQSFLLCF